MSPNVSRSVGEGRVTPSGRSLQGTWPETYIAFEIEVLPHDDLIVLLNRELPKLYARKDALVEIVDTGGGARFYILATPISSTFGEEIPWQTLLALAELHLSLCIEVYQST